MFATMPISRYFKSLRIVVPGHAKEPEVYLKLTQNCMERAQRLTSPSGFTSLKLNHRQCKYLADKLKLAVKAADSFLELLKRKCFWFPSPEDKANCVNIFRLLYASAKEVEDFIQSQTSKDAWIQAAMSLTNVSEYVSSIGFNLELWTLAFPKSEKARARRSVTLTEVDTVFKAEVENVKEKASGDRDALLRNLSAVLQTEKTNSTEYQQAAILLERLMGSRLIPGSSQSSLSETGYGSRNLMEQSGIIVSGSLNSLKRMERLGRGSAATVYRAMWLGGEVALKTFDGSNNSDFNQEVSILRRLSHPNIISLLCSTTNDRTCSIVVEKMDGDLGWLMHERREERKTEGGGNQEPPFDIMEGVDLMLQVGGGMQYLFDMRIVHRDLKSMNILVRQVRVKDRGQEIEYVVAKVADFGLSKTKESSRTYSNQTPNMGTTRWMAPEVMFMRRSTESEAEASKNKAMIIRHPFKSDVYSFGMVCYEILTGDVPFSKMSNPEVREFVMNDGRPPLPSHCPLLLKRLIKRCWSRDPSKRPGFGEICAELRHLKCVLLMPSALVEVNSLAVNIPEQPSASNSSTPIGFKRRGRHVEWLVALDFGTIYSGFAYAKVSNVDQMFVNGDYPYYYGQWTPRGNSSRRGVVEKPYCKTLTASFYARGLSRGQHGRPSWGYHAQHDYLANMEGLYLTELKSKTSMSKILANLPSWAARRSRQLTLKSITTDYLKYLGELALTAIETRTENEAASYFDRDSVLWCVSVPSTWDESTKQQMGAYMVNAGLVSGEVGPESVMFVQEPEAASFHCHQLLISDNHSLNVPLHVGDKILVVDMGGRSVDVVVQEVIRSGNNFKVQGLTKPSVELCGGASVDESFMKFLSKRIGCLDEFLREEDRYRWRLLMEWEDIKCGFGHEMMSNTDTVNITLHNILAAKWEAYDMEHESPPRESYSKIELTQEDLKSIFDPAVVKILGLISAQLMRVHGVQVMFVVGGFAGSPYLMQTIRARFSREVRHIFCPPDPGSAIMQGAIALALTPDAIAQAVTPDAIVPRILMKTYGITVPLPFEHGVDPNQLFEVKDGRHYCRNRFVPIFQKHSRIEGKLHEVVRIGPFDVPHTPGQTQILLELYSSSELDPRYTERASVAKEGNFVINLLEGSNSIFHIDEDEVEVTFKFTPHLGRSRVELRAEATVVEHYSGELRTMELSQVFPLCTCIASS